MDLSSIIEFTKQAALARSIQDVRYESLNAEQRTHIERALGYFDYFTGYEEGEDEAARQRRFNEAIAQFIADNALENLSPFQQFLTLLVGFLEGNGIDVAQTFGGLVPAEVLEASPSRRWQRNREPTAGQPVALPAAVEAGELGTRLAVPEGSASTNGRFRLVTVATGAEGRATTAEMAVLDTHGNVVWRSPMHSGSANRLDSLPGLRTAIDGRPITTEYRLDWNDVRLNRRDSLGSRGMSLSNGQPGYSFTLVNPDNMAEIGGAGRDYFRIHPGGRGTGTAGCLEFVDAEGSVNAASDRAAQSFLALMTSLPASQRPVSLEVLNASMLGRELPPQQRRPAQVVDTSSAAAPTPAPEAPTTNPPRQVVVAGVNIALPAVSQLPTPRDVADAVGDAANHAASRVRSVFAGIGNIRFG